MGKISLSDPNFEHRHYTPPTAYGQSKLANQVFALELDRRARRGGIDVRSIAAHPGLTSTELVANMVRSHGLQIFERLGTLGTAVFAQNVRQGALPQLYAATSPEAHGGDYIGPGSFRELRGYPKLVPLRSAAGRERIAEELWELTAAQTEVTPDPE
jgi:protochlorophyllide reductase